MIWFGFELTYKDWRGYGEVVELLAHTEEWAKSTVLVSSDPRGEEMLIAEVALGDNRPNRYVLRASKLLATDDWRGAGYKKRFASSVEVMIFLERLPIGVLIIDTSFGAEEESEYHRQLQAVTKIYAEKWRLIRQDDLTRDGHLYPAAIQVYALNGYEPQSVGDLGVRVEAALGRKPQSADHTEAQ